jgi:hypothetical protein
METFPVEKMISIINRKLSQHKAIKFFFRTSFTVNIAHIRVWECLGVCNLATEMGRKLVSQFNESVG